MNSIKQFRITNDIRQVEIAEYLGISKSFLSNVEADRCKLPADKLTKLMNNDKGWDTSMLYEPKAYASYSPHATDSGVAVSGDNNNIAMISERFIGLLEKKDEQIDKLLEMLTAKTAAQ